MVDDLGRDWAFVREAQGVLEDYLLSSELFWPLGGAVAGSSDLGMLQITLGNLALALRRLSAVEWPSAQQAELANLLAQVEAVRNRWRANWSKKAAQEYRSRLKQWTVYIQELNAERGRRTAGYAYQVRLRVILALLEDDLSPEDRLPAEALLQDDLLLRAITKPASFVWEAHVQPSFPQEPFWYLYVQP